MISIPAVKDCLLLVSWYGACLMEWALGMVGFAGGV